MSKFLSPKEYVNICNKVHHMRDKIVVADFAERFATVFSAHEDLDGLEKLSETLKQDYYAERDEDFSKTIEKCDDEIDRIIMKQALE